LFSNFTKDGVDAGQHPHAKFSLRLHPLNKLMEFSYSPFHQTTNSAFAVTMSYFTSSSSASKRHQHLESLACQHITRVFAL
jgi:hypothetical protein